MILKSLFLFALPDNGLKSHRIVDTRSGWENLRARLIFTKIKRYSLSSNLSWMILTWPAQYFFRSTYPCNRQLWSGCTSPLSSPWLESLSHVSQCLTNPSFRRYWSTKLVSLFGTCKRFLFRLLKLEQVFIFNIKIDSLLTKQRENNCEL